MIKTKLSNVYSCSVNGAFRELASMPLPFRTALEVKKLVRKLNNVLEALESDRKLIARNHGADVDQEKWEVPEENYSAFSKEFLTTLNNEITIDAEPVSIRESDLTGTNIKPIILELLSDTFVTWLED